MHLALLIASAFKLRVFARIMAFVYCTITSQFVGTVRIRVAQMWNIGSWLHREALGIWVAHGIRHSYVTFGTRTSRPVLNSGAQSVYSASSSEGTGVYALEVDACFFIGTL